mmetsp:Transcript_24923/g.63355  ORF Transcript_24923/g.63355 Transcript_24923/m.63355 type:complete len:414 (+) Transcript_24923:752-1993(+)
MPAEDVLPREDHRTQGHGDEKYHPFIVFSPPLNESPCEQNSELQAGPRNCSLKSLDAVLGFRDPIIGGGVLAHAAHRGVAVGVGDRLRTLFVALRQHREEGQPHSVAEAVGADWAAPALRAGQHVLGDISLQGAKIPDELSLLDDGLVWAGHPVEHFVDDLVGRFELRAAGEQSLQLFRIQEAIVVEVDAVPLIVERAREDSNFLFIRHVATCSGSRAKCLTARTASLLVESIAAFKRRRAAFVSLPELEQHLGLKVWNSLVQHLTADDIHEPVGSVLVLQHQEAQVVKVRLGTSGLAEVHGVPSLPEQENIIEECEERVSWLVDHHDACHTQLAHLLQGVHHGQGTCRIQARCGLIQEQHRRLCRKLQTDVHSLALASANATFLDAADDAILDVVDLHDVEHVLGDEFDPGA